MTKLGRKITASIAAAGLVLGTFASTAVAATNVEISDNGAFSDNSVRVRQNQDTNVHQTNRANINNSVDIDANTGNNRANFNTDGDVRIRTGDVNSSVDISNRANVNHFNNDNFDRNHNNNNDWNWNHDNWNNDKDKDWNHGNNYIVIRHGGFDRDKNHGDNYKYNNAKQLHANMNGENVVRGDGDRNGWGTASIWLDPRDDRLCSTLNVHNISSATGAGIYYGSAGDTGPLVVSLGTPNNDGYSRDCMSVDSNLLDKISDKPWHYYVNVSNDQYPDGAIRGQLSH